MPSIQTIIIRGSPPNWPSGCTCCDADATTVHEVERYSESVVTENPGPMETMHRVGVTVGIPVCDACARHVRGAERFDSGCMLGGLGTMVASIGLYVLLITRFRSPIADLLGIGARNAFIPIGIITVLFFAGAAALVVALTSRSLSQAKTLTPSCTHPDGGVRFTAFDVGDPESYRFTFRRAALCSAFLEANFGTASRAEKADAWARP